MFFYALQNHQLKQKNSWNVYVNDVQRFFLSEKVLIILKKIETPN